MKSLLTFIIAVCTLVTSSCQTGSNVADGSATTATNPYENAPAFDADSAYSFVAAQLDFGPRVPGSEGHRKCGEYIVTKMSAQADTVITQKTTVTAFTGARLPITNILARFNPDAQERILILAHWDTRPWADADRNEQNHNKPIPGANDGGSGVAVMMELSRHIKGLMLSIGVDLLFVDAEDHGDSDGFGDTSSTWCLGTQYFAEHLPYTPESMPKYGICLDMVGGTGAVFHRDYVSNQAAGNVVDRVWSVAAVSGYGDRFINELGGSIVDDHLFINRAGIPCIDIVEHNSRATGTFPASWHTMADNLDNIDHTSLKAVGQTILNLLYSERDL